VPKRPDARNDSLRRSIPCYDPSCAAICEVPAVARRMQQDSGNPIIGF
jgi:hypothetical protein